MGKRLVWFESYKTICKYSVELTDEQVKLFEEDEETETILLDDDED